jgi:hypothetical protein
MALDVDDAVALFAIKPQAKVIEAKELHAPDIGVVPEGNQADFVRMGGVIGVDVIAILRLDVGKGDVDSVVLEDVADMDGDGDQLVRPFPISAG